MNEPNEQLKAICGCGGTVEVSAHKTRATGFVQYYAQCVACHIEAAWCLTEAKALTAFRLATRSRVVDQALELAIRYGQIEGDHHRAWVIDQIVRLLAGDQYDALTKEEGYNKWDTGIAP